jgi:hypothetical protein
MSKGLGSCQKFVVDYIDVVSFAYQAHIYERGMSDGYTKPAICRAIKTLIQRGKIVKTGRGRFTMLQAAQQKTQFVTT